MPGPLGKGELDGALRAAILERLPRTSFLPPAVAPAEGQDAAGPGEPIDGLAGSEPAGERDRDLHSGGSLRPRDAEVVEGAGADTVRVLAEVLPTLLPAGLERRSELRTLGVARVPLTDAVDRLAGLEKEPGWWRRLYDSLAGVDPDRLSGLPVPLADGRTTIGPRQVLLPSAGRRARSTRRCSPGSASRSPTRTPRTRCWRSSARCPRRPRAVLTTPQVRAAVAASLDDEGGLDWEQDAPGRRGAGRHRPRARPGRGAGARRRALARRPRPARRGGRTGPRR